jgi:hypothetical protein
METLEPGKEVINFVKVEQERALEFTIVLAFTNVEITEKIDVEIEYFGANCETPCWNSNQAAHPIRIWNSLKKLDIIQPSFTFRHVAQTIRPESAKIKPLGPRDIYDNGIQLDNLILNYKFTGMRF